MDANSVAKRLEYDGSSESTEGYKSYYFVTTNMKDAEDVFYELYEEDIYDYAAQTVLEDDYEVVDCTVSLEADLESGEVGDLSISATTKVEKDGEEEYFGEAAFIGCEDEEEEEYDDYELLKKLLLEKIPKE